MSASHGEAENPGTGRRRAHGRVFSRSACLKEIIDEDSNGELPVFVHRRAAGGGSRAVAQSNLVSPPLNVARRKLALSPLDVANW
jgi:hypothetical protein